MGPKSRASTNAEPERANAEILGARTLEQWDDDVAVDADTYVRWLETGAGDDPCPDFSE
jgi:hypothetical protein